MSLCGDRYQLVDALGAYSVEEMDRQLQEEDYEEKRRHGCA